MKKFIIIRVGIKIAGWFEIPATQIYKIFP